MSYIKNQDEFNLAFLKNSFKLAENFKELIIGCVTGQDYRDKDMNSEYATLREGFLKESNTKNLIPFWIKENRSLSEIFSFLTRDMNIATYQRRRDFIKVEFSKLLNFLEFDTPHLIEKNISCIISEFKSEHVLSYWKKGIERKASNPDGSITMAKSLLESVCKHILDFLGINYTGDENLHKLFKTVLEHLDFGEDKYSGEIIKKILGASSGLVSSLGELRNKCGDGHGGGSHYVKPPVIYAELAIHLSGVITSFLIQVFEEKIK